MNKKGYIPPLAYAVLVFFIGLIVLLFVLNAFPELKQILFDILGFFTGGASSGAQVVNATP